MKQKILLFVMLVLFSFVSAKAQDNGDMMKKWQEYMTPGPVHQSFAKMCGNWKADVTSYMGGQEMKSEGTAVYEMVLDGRYLKSTFKSTMMGMPMEGMGLDGYDNATKEFLSVWIDNMGTGILYMKGKMEGNAVTYTGTMVDPMTGGETKYKTVMTMINDNKNTFDMYSVVDGKDVKQMSITYTR
jgi:hypothetical protein